MTTRTYFLGLTRLAFLDAIVIILLSLQFVFIPFLLVNIIIVPTIFALQIFYISPKYWFLSSVILIIFSSVCLGLDTGFWTSIYFLLGLILGICKATRVPNPISILTATITFSFSIIGAIDIFRKFARINLEDLFPLVNKIPAQLLVLVIWILIAGLFIWALISCITANSFFRKIINQLEGDF